MIEPVRLSLLALMDVTAITRFSGRLSLSFA